MDMPKFAEVHCRWMIQRDWPWVLRTEKAYTHPWTKADLANVARKRNRIGMVAVRQDLVTPDMDLGVPVGHMVYDFHLKHLEIVRFTVNPDFRRSGVGTRMFQKLQRKLSEGKRESIVMLVREHDESLQFFCRSVGFRAIRVLRGFFRDMGGDGEEKAEDAYEFLYQKGDSA
jgi:ribosomal-protein-alanine N-acetyltransferase